ncbi:uncharacterized protein LOC131637081 [Vicia villosa]|uniref:uncharacterized protein LOC131637081 n=1 Tax=Vicia villosa TaxID=3911 RepID=UPI00273AC760|nr:uncharacterized protein LOC131637081 [Vicia villosa]
MESRLKEEEVQSVKFKCGFDGSFLVNCSGLSKDRAGRLILFWKDSSQVSILSFSTNHIGGSVTDNCDSQDWFFCGLYGHPEEHNKRRTWRLLQEERRSYGDRFLCFGDLNDILFEGEKQGGIPRSLRQFSWGRQSISNCGLIDLGFEGYPFTWTNGRKGEENRQCRLDRCLASEGYINRFSPIKVSHLEGYGSDHVAVRIILEDEMRGSARKRQHIFRFKEVWSRDPKCENMVGRLCKNPGVCILNKFEAMKELDSVFKGGEEDIASFKALEVQRDRRLHVEEVSWRQRSMALWLKHGDKNTKGKLKVDHIDWCARRFTQEEVKVALFQMQPLKAPGPDGLPALFYQKHWNIMGTNVCNLALDVLNNWGVTLNNNKSPSLINGSFIALIPKCKKPSTSKDFKPISLCNVVLKIITKAIANRIKMKKKTKGKKGVMAMKLDMSKAYDRLEWPFVVAFLSSMGFPETMVVNLDKLEFSFSRDVKDEEKDQIRVRLGMNTMASHFKFLGLPVLFSRSRKEVFAMVVEKVWKNLKGWKEKFLSRAGLVAMFWWGSRNEEKKIHWMSWKKLACAKGEGGLGFRGFKEFNTSLLGKTYWRLLNDGESLLGRVLKGRYFPRGSIDDNYVAYAPSYAWRSIISARELILQGSRWRIGNGKKVRILKDSWISSNSGFRIIGSTRGINENASVQELIDPDLGIWKQDVIRGCFEPFEASLITSIPLSRSITEDKRIWHHEKNGCYSDRSGYHCCLKMQSDSSPSPSSFPLRTLWKEIWKAPVQAKIRNFLWRLTKDILPTKVNLLKKGIILDDCCSPCNSSPESAHHLLMECPFVRQTLFSSILSYRTPSALDLCDWIRSFLVCGDKLSAQFLPTVLHKVWTARNLVIYQQKSSSPISVAANALYSVKEFNLRNSPVVSITDPRVQPLMNDIPADFTLIQVDAGVFPDGSVSYGCVFKNQISGSFFAVSKRELLTVDPGLAELLAIHWSLSLAGQFKLRSIMVHSDAKVVVDCINSLVDVPALEPIANDCRILLRKFDVGSILFISRTLNMDAHNLVGLGHMYGSKTLFGGYPSMEPFVTVSSFRN